MRRVETEFNSLVAMVSLFFSLCERLRADIVAMGQKIAAARGDAKRLHDKIDGAKARLEGLLSRLPG